MKDIKHFKYCEYCNEEYECYPDGSFDSETIPNGFIEIDNKVTIIIRLGRKDIDGIYCDIECLKKYIEEL